MKYELLTYEQEMARIDEIAAQLSSDLQLNRSIELYEEAAERIQHCRNLLADAELKIINIASSFQQEDQQ